MAINIIPNFTQECSLEDYLATKWHSISFLLDQILSLGKKYPQSTKD